MLKVLDFMVKMKIFLGLSIFLFCLNVYGEETFFESISPQHTYSWIPFEEHQRLQIRVAEKQAPALRFHNYFIADDTPYENFMGWKNSLIIFDLNEGFFLFDLSLQAQQIHYFNWLIERGRLSATITEYVKQPAKKSLIKVVRELSLEELVQRRNDLLQFDRIDGDYLREFRIGIIRDSAGRKNLLPVMIKPESLIFSDSQTVRALVLEVIEEIRALSDGEEPKTHHVSKIIDLERDNYVASTLENLLFGCLHHLVNFGVPEAADMFQDFVRRGFFTSKDSSYWYVILRNRDHLDTVSPEGWVDRVTAAMRMNQVNRNIQSELARAFRARYGTGYDTTERAHFGDTSRELRPR